MNGCQKVVEARAGQHLEPVTALGGMFWGGAQIWSVKNPTI